MNQMPLLPRSCELFVGGVGERNSRWSWTSPKLWRLTSVLSLPPTRGGTVSTPSLSVQAVPVPRHAASDVPSKRTIASDGGAPGAPPGVTTAGCGRSASCTRHWPPGSSGVSRKPGASCEQAGPAVSVTASAAAHAIGFTRLSPMPRRSRDRRRPAPPRLRDPPWNYRVPSRSRRRKPWRAASGRWCGD